MMEVYCPCDDWVKSFPQIRDAQISAYYHGTTYSGVVFRFCPWCGSTLNALEPEGVISKAALATDPTTPQKAR